MLLILKMLLDFQKIMNLKNIHGINKVHDFEQLFRNLILFMDFRKCSWKNWKMFVKLKIFRNFDKCFTNFKKFRDLKMFVDFKSSWIFKCSRILKRLMTIYILLMAFSKSLQILKIFKYNNTIHGFENKLWIKSCLIIWKMFKKFR